MAHYQHGVIKMYPDHTEEDFMHYCDAGFISVKHCEADNTITISAQSIEEETYVSIHLTRQEFIDIFNKVMGQTFLNEGNHDE
jgi:hypothetical protein